MKLIYYGSQGVEIVWAVSTSSDILDHPFIVVKDAKGLTFFASRLRLGPCTPLLEALI